MMRSVLRRGVLPSWVVIAAVAVAGCGPEGASTTSKLAADDGRETIYVAREGGQTGMEGSCLVVPEPEPFSAIDVSALIAGTWDTTLAYRARNPSLDLANAAVGMPMKLQVELNGEGRLLEPGSGESCHRVIERGVTLRLSFDETALDVVIQATARAFSDRFAVVQRELGDDVAAALGLPRRKLTLSLAFDDNGVSGMLDPHDECGAAVFPADARCPEWARIEVDLDRERDGFRPRDALTALGELGEMPLRWSDGSETTLTLALAQQSTWACSGDWVATFRPESLDLWVSARVTTADGRLVDAELPAELSVEVSTEASAAHAGDGTQAGVMQSLSLIADGAGVTDEQGVTLRVFQSKERTYAEAQPVVLGPWEPDLSPPIEATLPRGGAGCVAPMPASAGMVSEP